MKIKSNALTRKNADEVALNNREDTNLAQSRRGNKVTKRYNYKYIGRGVRVLANQYWEKGKLIKQEKISDDLRDFEDIENHSCIEKERFTCETG